MAKLLLSRTFRVAFPREIEAADPVGIYSVANCGEGPEKAARCCLRRALPEAPFRVDASVISLQ